MLQGSIKMSMVMSLSQLSILRAFASDKRFGQQLFRDLKVNENDLKDAISAVRGSQRVTDQNMSQLHIVFPMRILGSFA
jgi:patatin-like phospholipase/acyl hydrolase